MKREVTHVSETHVGVYELIIVGQELALVVKAGPAFPFEKCFHVRAVVAHGLAESALVVVMNKVLQGSDVAAVTPGHG